MVKRTFALLRRFSSDTSGVTLVETLLVMPIVITVLMAMVELGVALFQWNQSVKAVQIGARLAAVSSPLITSAQLTALEALEAGDPDDPGDPVPNTILSQSCGGGTTPCETAPMNRLLRGGDNVCGGTTITPPVGVCDVNPQITEDNLLITYRRTRLGYIGRPFGPVLSITVQLVDFDFDFLFLDNILPGNLSSIQIPAHPVTFTSEDLSDCKDYGCP